MQRGMGAIAMAVLAVAGCDQARPPTDAAAPAAEAPLPVATPVADLEAFSGRPYADFAAAHAERFNHQALGLSAEDGARVDRVMGGAPGVLLQGGGAEALVFRG